MLSEHGGDPAAGLNNDLEAVTDPTPALSQSTSSTGLKRKRGRPLGSHTLATREDSSQPRRPVGRPRGSGPKQRARASRLPQDEPDDPALKKRRVGRPRKDVGGDIGMGVSIEFGNLVVPGTTSIPQTRLPLALSNPRTSHSQTSLPVGMKPVEVRSQSPVSKDHGATISTGSARDDEKIRLQRIIPDEDPERLVDPDDDDDESGEGFASGEGLGCEDDRQDASDEFDDERDPMEEEASEIDTKHPRSRRLPNWLLKAFEDRLAEAGPAFRNDEGLPRLYYENKTFWFPCHSNFFVLRSETPSPQQLHNSRFFLWDPEPLCKGIPCPNCKTILQRHAHISHPRRVVDADSTFWIIGYRYRCRVCIHPKSKKFTVTFRSWDSRILAALPRSLADEFPARLSHRSGMSKTVFSWMRACFQCGMGAKQFSDALRVQHLLKYDELHLQYLHELASRSLDGWRGQKYERFLAFDNTSPQGPHGFVPGAQWLKDMYDCFIEEHQHDFNQHTAMLSAEICALDHSHKITKHIAKVNGEQVFTGLLTVTNEKGEIRCCNLVATKSHAQYEPALQEMRKSLELYGLRPPSLFYTDNVAADKGFLEDIYPSLRENVVPIEKYSNLEPLIVPPDVQVFLKNTKTSINDAISTILDDLPHASSDNLNAASLVVGFDSEWNVEVSPNGKVLHRGKTAVVQIAYQTRIYVLQIGDMLAAGEIPHQLRMLLSDSRVKKVGRLIGADLKYLQSACQSPTPFVGALDLAKYAKDRRVISNATCSLEDLCAKVLGKCLKKNLSERISQAWENESLTADQLSYAATDAYAALLLYQALSPIQVPQSIPKDAPRGTPVLVYSTDNTVAIAYGRLSHATESSDNIRLTSRHTLVDIQDIFVPGAIVSSHQKKSLNSFGDLPFQLVCLWSHLREFHPSIFPNPRVPCSDPITLESSCSDSSTLSNNLEADASHGSHGDGGSSIGDIILDKVNLSQAEGPISQTGPREIDLSSASQGKSILGDDSISWDNQTRSRVLKDVFHIFNMFRVPSNHGLRIDFAQALRDAIFIPDLADRKRIQAWASIQMPAQSFDQLRATRPSWLWRHCKRTIPPPNILYPLVNDVFHKYGPLKDAATGVPLFDQKNWKTAKHILNLIKKGLVSDPPGIPLYTVIGLDKKAGGLPMYRCARGTNSTEGGVHTHLRSRLPTSGASIRHVYACLLDFILRHNLLVGTLNSTGLQYLGHYCIWTTNELQEHLVALREVFIDPTEMSGWVNGNLYIPTSEVLGIIPIPAHIQHASGMAEFSPTLDCKQRHEFLARLQHTRKPVLPVHTPTERTLFRTLMDKNPEFNAKSGPIWRNAVKVWNHYADTDNLNNVSYKLREHLEAYHAQWSTNVNIKESLSLSFDVRKPLTAILRDSARSVAAPPVPQQNMNLHSVDKGLLTLPTTAQSNHNHPSLEPQSLLVPQNPQGGQSSNQQLETTIPVAELLARQRVREAVENARNISKKPRKRRTCAKCGELTCHGNQKVANCKNPCQDCGKKECRGRNMKRPNKPCYEGWMGVEEGSRRVIPES